jgi:ABC-2 type transport system permease protein
MKTIGRIAQREFIATVTTRGFIVGLLIVPVMMALVSVVAPRLMQQRGSQVRGQVAVIDPTGQVTRDLRAALDPRAIADRRVQAARRALGALPPAVRAMAGGAGAVESATIGAIPDLEVVEGPPGADAQQQKAWLAEPSQASRHLAVVVVHQDAVSLGEGRSEYGTYDLYVPVGLDDRVETVIHESVREAMIAARMRSQDLDRDRVEAIVRVARRPSVTVTRNGERATVGGFNRALPFVFVGLLVFSVMTGGQGLVTSMVEEKSSRVIEVLLSAVSPFELMAGKILGQMCVSLVVLALYIGLGLVVLASFTMLGLLSPSLVFYLIVFFVITYLTIGSAMVAVGSAVNEMREAQSLMMPVVLLMMLPWVFAGPIAREPNSAFSVMMSFLPPVNTFAMLLRLTSTAPPPAWQVWLTIAIGIAGVGAAVWCASRIFRIGLLMHGKPPDAATLLRWARGA